MSINIFAELMKSMGATPKPPVKGLGHGSGLGPRFGLNAKSKASPSPSPVPSLFPEYTIQDWFNDAEQLYTLEFSNNKQSADKAGLKDKCPFTGVDPNTKLKCPFMGFNPNTKTKCPFMGFDPKSVPKPSISPKSDNTNDKLQMDSMQSILMAILRFVLSSMENESNESNESKESKESMAIKESMAAFVTLLALTFPMLSDYISDEEKEKEKEKQKEKAKEVAREKAKQGQQIKIYKPTFDIYNSDNTCEGYILHVPVDDVSNIKLEVNTNELRVSCEGKACEKIDMRILIPKDIDITSTKAYMMQSIKTLKIVLKRTQYQHVPIQTL